MKTESIDMTFLEGIFADLPQPSADSRDPLNCEDEHPLARKLRLVLADPEEHSIGDLSRVVDSILREMTMLKGGAGTASQD